MEIITVKRESYAQRAKAVAEADQTRARNAIIYSESPTEKNYLLHRRAYKGQVDLMTYPLVTTVRVLGIPIPLAGGLFPTRWFIKEPVTSYPV